MTDAGDFHHDDAVTIRTYTAGDQSVVARLYTEGLLAGQIADNDTGADIDMIDEAYLRSERSHFWVAEHKGRVVGMIGVADDGDDVAEVRRLRVDHDFQNRGIAGRLLEMAVQFCRHHGYLKVRLDTRLETGSNVVATFDRFAFQHARSREVPGKELLEFYLDLYRDPDREEE